MCARICESLLCLRVYAHYVCMYVWYVMRVCRCVCYVVCMCVMYVCYVLECRLCYVIHVLIRMYA